MKSPWLVSLAAVLATAPACSTDPSLDDAAPDSSPPRGDSPPGDEGGDEHHGGDSGDDSDGAGGGGDGAGGGGDGAGQPRAVEVSLVPQTDDVGAERVNFALPLARDQLRDPGRIRVVAGDDEIPAYVEAIAWYPDDSIQSAQIQVDVDLDVHRQLTLDVGAEASAGSLDAVPVSDTLIAADGTQGPRVLAVLPPSWLAESGVIGPPPASEPAAGQTLGPWAGVCDYDRYDTSRFLADSGSRGAWLYDRPTALFRLHATSGAALPLRDALREAHIYREAITGSGRSTRIGVPTAQNDLKYHYAQGMAIAYLLTGDDRFRRRAEDVADRASDLWVPDYVPGGRFWTERHAGFALLTYVWAARVSYERRDDFTALADEAVQAHLHQQSTRPPGYGDPDARCFSYDSGRGYEGCSPWLSAILADGIAEYAAWRGGERAASARESIVRLGRLFARDGIDPSGKPYYWIAGDGSRGEVDPNDEHWGEMAYVIAMAWHYDGRRDDGMRSAAEGLISGLSSRGVSPHTRSFNWQCRGAPLTPLYLADDA